MRFLTPFFLVLSLALQAAPVGNTSFPKLIKKGLFTRPGEWSDLRGGYEGDFVADGRMQQYEKGTGRVDLYDQETNSGTVTWNIRDRIDFYGVFGSSRTKADWRFTDAAGTIHRIKMKTAENFLWAVGGRAIFCEWRCLAFGIGGRYTTTESRLSRLTSDGIPASTAGGHLRWSEYQINFDFSYQMSLFTPYIGTKYAHARTELNNFSVPISNSGTGSNDFKTRVPVGLYLGCALTTGDYMMFNVEGRLIDEEAITVSADVRF